MKKKVTGEKKRKDEGKKSEAASDGVMIAPELNLQQAATVGSLAPGLRPGLQNNVLTSRLCNWKGIRSVGIADYW